MTDMQCGFKYVPGTALNGQMSVRYTLAVALIEGQVLPRHFADDKLHDPLLVRLANEMELVPDAELDKYYPSNFAGWVAVEHRGEWLRVDVLNATGSESKPIDAAGVTEKFRGLHPNLPTDEIAATAFAMERHGTRELLALVSARTWRTVRA